MFMSQFIESIIITHTGREGERTLYYAVHLAGLFRNFSYNGMNFKHKICIIKAKWFIK